MRSKSKIVTVIKIALAVLILWYLANTSLLKLNLLVHILNKPGLVVCTLGLLIATVLVNARRWYRLNTAQGISISFVNTIFPTYLGTAFSNVLPGAIGGDFVRLYYLFNTHPQNKSGAVLSILFDRVTGLMGVLFTIFLFTLPIFLLSSTKDHLHYILASCLIFSGIGLMVFFSFVFLPQFVWSWLSYLRKLSSTFFDAMEIYRKERFVIFECTFLSILIQFLIVMTIIVIAKTMDFPALSFSSFAIAVTVTQIVNLIPASPGGIGIGEIAFANLLILLNPGTSAAFATLFLAYRMIGLLVYLPGVIFYFLGTAGFQRKKLVQENTIQPI